MAPTRPSESRNHTPSPAADLPATDPVAAVLPSMDRPGWRFPWPADTPDPARPKGCLKSAAGTPRQGISVRFTDGARCLVSGVSVPPHPTTRGEWMRALARQRFVRAFRAGLTREEVMDDIEAIDPRRVAHTRWQTSRRLRLFLDPEHVDPWDVEALVFRLLFRRARKHMLRNMVGCPIQSRRDRTRHPALGGSPDPDPDPPRA